MSFNPRGKASIVALFQLNNNNSLVIVTPVGQRILITLLIFATLILGKQEAKAVDEPVGYQVTYSQTLHRGGGAYVHMHGDVNRLEKIVIDYERYYLMFPRFKVDVISQTSSFTLVKFETPTGFNFPLLPKTLWAIMRFHVKHTTRSMIVKGTYISGNLRDAKVRFIVKPGASNNSSSLFVELLIAPRFPVPQNYVTKQLMSAAKEIARKFSIHAEMTN